MTPKQIEAYIRRWRRESHAKAKREGRFYGKKAPDYVNVLERQTEEAIRKNLRTGTR